MVLEAGYLELPSNLISNLFNMHLGIERIRRGPLELDGSLESMLELEN